MNGKWIVMAALAFGAALAALVVERLDSQALALLAGAACGVAASVPITAFVVWFSQRSKTSAQPEARKTPDTPQVIVVQPPPHFGAPIYPSLPPATGERERDFNIIGDDEEE